MTAKLSEENLIFVGLATEKGSGNRYVLFGNPESANSRGAPNFVTIVSKPKYQLTDLRSPPTQEALHALKHAEPTMRITRDGDLFSGNTLIARGGIVMRDSGLRYEGSAQVSHGYAKPQRRGHSARVTRHAPTMR